MKKHIVIFPLLILFLLTISNVKGTCMMYGICHKTQTATGITYQNCNTTGAEPLPLLDEKAKLMLKENCDFMFEDTDDPEVCCDKQQVEVMTENIAMLSVFSRCPSCMKNIITNICMFSCSKDQDDFLEIIDMSDGPGNIKPEQYITEINVYIDKTFMDTTFESCKSVTMPQTGSYVMDVMGCGNFGLAYCTSQRFFNFLGLDNPYLPFLMNYKPVDNPEIYISRARHCNESYEENGLPCSCIDCPVSCVLDEFPAHDEGFLILDLNGYTFIVAIVLFALSFIVTIVLYVLFRRLNQNVQTEYVEKEDLNKEIEENDESNIVHRILGKIFRKFGIGK